MKSTDISHAWNGAEKCRLCPVKDLVLFADLQRDDFDLLHLPIVDFELLSGETLYKEQQAPNFVYTLRSGLIKLVHYLPDGSYRIVRLLHQGDLAGIEALNRSSYLHHAIALQNTSICKIPVEDIGALLAITTETASRIIAEFKRLGYLQTQRQIAQIDKLSLMESIK